MTMMLGPSKAVLAGTLGEDDEPPPDDAELSVDDAELSDDGDDLVEDGDDLVEDEAAGRNGDTE
jgi:hypothetical protein